MSDQSITPPPPPPGAPGTGGDGYPQMGSMPGPGVPPPAAPVSRPASIDLAVKLMYVGAVLSLLGMVLTVTMRDTIRSAVEKASNSSSAPMTASQVDAAVGLAVGVSVVVGLIGVGLWLWMAWANGKGRKWARIVATVFFGLSVLSTLSSLLQHPPVLSLVVALVNLLLGAYIIFLLYRPESTQYYEAQSAPRY
ncbi:hypothetical protein ACFUC1_15635 [Pedococcus sp. NPDC057267]|uniref:hypothetical protein n=1 Tax=Pedococcus sp. NPDC057267 TaxID=3346077 RepID=UPI00362BA36A